MIKKPPSFTTDPDPPIIDIDETTIGTKYFEDANVIRNEMSSSQNSNFQIKSEPDCNPYQHYQTTIPPGKQDRLKPGEEIVGSKLFNDIQRPLESSSELAQRLDQLSKIVSHLVVNIQDNTNGLKVLTDTLLQPAKVSGELIKGYKFPISNMDELNALEEKLRAEPDFKSDLVRFDINH